MCNRVIYFTPMVAAPAAVAMVWSWLYNTEFGALNQLLGNLGFQTHSWLNDPKYAMLSIVIIAIWGGMGQQIIILIVAITNVPKTYYEAAAIDGANGFVKLFKITVPLISPSVFFLTITGFIGSLTQFDLIYMLYGNNTSKAMDSVRTIMFQYYREAFVVQDKPYASAISIIALCVIMIFTAVQFAAQKKIGALRLGGKKLCRERKKLHVGTHVILIAGSIIMLFPFFWMVLSSFKTVGEQMMIPMQILPSSFKNTENFRQALDAVPFLRLYGNTLLMIAGRVLCAVIFFPVWPVMGLPGCSFLLRTFCLGSCCCR